ncbi:hypothetical protein [Aquimarina rhabdastrellae]
MKKLLLTIFTIAISLTTNAQTFTSNEFPVGMEHNVLFNANNSFNVTQTGSARLDLGLLFDGRYVPSYTTTAPTPSDPTVILIENLPYQHTQLGAWVGWTTRYWQASRFKIEGYDTYESANTWRVIADYSTQDYTSRKFFKKIPNPGAYTKLRYTFYSAVGANGRLGVSELVFIHPEAVSPYQGLISSSSGNSLWEHNSSKIYYNSGNVGIGTNNPGSWKLAVNGEIRAKEIKVETGWSDFVFYDDYQLPTLEEVERYIEEKGHLKDIPSAKDVEENGIFLGKMDARLLQKIEELTLYTIQQEKKIEKLEEKNKELEILNKKLSSFQSRLEKLESK